MVIFKPETKLFGYEIVREGREDILYINCLQYAIVPSIADDSLIMARIIDSLAENPKVSRIVLSQHKNYSYDTASTSMLIEIANIYSYLLKQEKLLSVSGLAAEEIQFIASGIGMLRYLALTLLRTDPIGCYVTLARLLREEKIRLENMPEEIARVEKIYISKLERFYSLLGQTKLIQLVREKIAGYKVGSREIYSSILRPEVIPNFIFTRLMADIPVNAELVEEYTTDSGGIGGQGKSEVTILKLPEEIKYHYHIMPPEFKLDEDSLLLLDLAKQVLLEHRPKSEEFLDPERMRQVFFNISRDLITELAQSRGIKLNYKEIANLADILVRHTVGFGLLEVILADEKLQDVVVNSPIGQTRIFVRHQDYDECFTNIIPSPEDAESWAARFRLISGRPLDEAHPILDTELVLENAKARVAVIQSPLSPEGLAYAFRRHRDKPWTLPLFMQNRMLNPLASGLLSFLIDGGRTLLIAGTRSSGKTSLLSSLLFELMPKYRVITIEDTLELPVNVLRELGYDSLRMKVRAALLTETTEVAADEGIRTSLRLGDSVLIVGEVRSLEAKALYEAMRIGALANVVAGTIHGASPYAVFDRVVNDLNVPRTSFKATDIIVVANPIRSPDGLHTSKRVLQITEVRKKWQEDPLAEKGFVDLMRYNVKFDELEPTQELIVGESEILKDIASNVKEWAGNWDAVWDNIQLRANIKRELLSKVVELKNSSLLEAPFVVKSNSAFHQISDEILQESGSLDSKRILSEWKAWLSRELKRQRF